MTPADLATPDLQELERLAREAQGQIDAGNEWNRRYYELADLGDALDPSTVLALVAQARRAGELAEAAGFALAALNDPEPLAEEAKSRLRAALAQPADSEGRS